jgi:riboflavin synthase
MFTGIVSAVGLVAVAEAHRLGIRHPEVARRLKIGSSVAVNGCCLTVVDRSAGTFYADVVPETLRRTNLGALRRGSKVNLELPVVAGAPMDGHLVQGHVDATARVRRVLDVASGREVEIDLPAGLRPFVVEKGSIAVDGMSLTVAGVSRGSTKFSVALIPHTLSITIAGGYAAGVVVNLEADVVARYVARATRKPRR